MNGVSVFVILAPIAIILFLCFLLWILLAVKKAGKMESLQKWDPRIRSPERASRIPEVTSNTHQETRTDAVNSPRVPGQQPSQQSLRVNLPSEIILSPSQHIINPKSDRPPSYESLFPV